MKKKKILLGTADREKIKIERKNIEIFEDSKDLGDY